MVVLAKCKSLIAHSALHVCHLYSTSYTLHCVYEVFSMHSALIQGFSEKTSRSLRISWSSCSGATRYYIDYKRSSSSYWMTVEVGNVISTRITNLVPSTTYYFRVQCANSTDRGWFSSTRNANTPPDPGMCCHVSVPISVTVMKTVFNLCVHSSLNSYNLCDSKISISYCIMEMFRCCKVFHRIHETWHW